MEQYKYQMHIHTKPCSRCSLMTPYELCKGLYDNGYKGAVLTNHFMNGNTGVDRNLPWAEFVAAFEKDYLECLDAAKEFDLDILFGIEEVVVPGLEILCYGLTPEILYDNPVLGTWGLEKRIKILRDNGVVVIQAHPYREASYIPDPRPLPLELVDGIEVYNLGNSSNEMNKKAMALAKAKPHLITTSGADAHWAECIPYGGIVVKKRIRTAKELADTLKNREFEIILP